MKNNFLLFIFFIFISTSCFREEIISNEAMKIYEEKPVVYCFLTEEDSISVWVAHTLPVYDQFVAYSDTYVFDAKVFIKNEENEQIELFLQNDSLPIYVASEQDFKIEKGQKYFLEVLFSNNYKITAETEIPAIKDTLNTTITYDLTYEDYIYFYPIEFKWLNNSGLQNVLFCESAMFCSNCVPPQVFYGFSNVLFGDLITVGNENTLNWSLWLDENSEYIGDYIYYHLYTVNNDITEFSKSFDLYQNVEENIRDNSFLNLFRGVIPEFTNINGGYGVFGAYLSDTDSVKVYPE